MPASITLDPPNRNLDTWLYDTDIPTEAEQNAQLSLSGTIGNGNTLTIATNGTYNFGTKLQSTPIIYDRFNGTDGQLVSEYDPLWVPYAGGGALISSNHQRYVGSKSAYNDTTRDGFASNNRFFSGLKKCRLSYWAYAELGSAGTSGQIKLSRVLIAPNLYNGHGTLFLTSWHPNTSDTSILSVDSGASSIGSGLFGANYINMVRNAWMKIEEFIDHSTPGLPDGTYYASVNNGQYTAGAFGTVQTRDADVTSLATRVILGTMLANQNADFPMKIQNSDFMFDAGWNKVVISNTQTITPASIVEDQPYSAWANNSVTITQNHGAISGAKWLKIFNDSNVEIASRRIA